MSGPQAGERVRIDGLAHDGRGVGRLAGKAVFVAGALPGEQARIRRLARHARHDEAQLLELLEASADRVVPPCAAFARCGGCALQHLAPAAQLAAKSTELLSQLKRIGRLEPARVLQPVTGPDLGYRRRARLGVKYLAREKRAIVGFRARDSAQLAALDRCPVLAAPADELCAALAALIGTLTIPTEVPQIEVAVTDAVTVLVLRLLAPLGAGDAERLRVFAREHGIEFWLQPGEGSVVEALDPPGSELSYRLEAFDLTLGFAPLDFVQVNATVNERLVAQTLELLAPEAGDAVLDLFAGLGNFTLPIARRAKSVIGVDADEALIGRARDNARRNSISTARFALANLAGELKHEPWAREKFDLVLLDPPRGGALEVLPLIGRGSARRVVYISCHPGTLARDAGILVHQFRYRLVAAGVMDMFPHTAHLESIAVFESAR